ncbi:MAG: hypothetical protein BWY82_01157 [Verrucomicrobia bacterium ADurb.Bin474]|nr:MAG: hypothetical protein BWY82_01157 [Verrucomicrobia bacterium ADurb.Bin474]
MASPFDEALDQDHPAKFVSDVKLKEVLTSPWRAYAPSELEGLQMPQLRFGNILSVVNLLFCASKTYVARRAYSEHCERC